MKNPTCVLQGIILVQIFILLICARLSDGQFPRECIKNATKPNEGSRCCPVWAPDGSPPGVCGGSNRGMCLPLDDVTEFFFPSKLTHRHDDRLNWPKAFFTWVCQCSGNFAGYKCQDCKFGYYGDDCSRKRILKRRNIFSLSKKERNRFVKLVLESKTTMHADYVAIQAEHHDPVENFKFVNVSIYDFFIYIHYYSARNTYFRNKTLHCDPEPFNYDFSHKGSGFPTFHRLLMLLWERELRKLAEDDEFTIPYWDWVDQGDRCSVCTNDLFGAFNYSDPKGHIDRRSPFYKWYSLCEMLGSANLPDTNYTLASTNVNDNLNFQATHVSCRFCDPLEKFAGIVRRRDPHNPQLPSLRHVDQILAMSTYDRRPYNKYAGSTFRNCFEGNCPENGMVYSIHNLVHAFFNGSLSGVTTSPNDPLFLVHHSMIDKLFERWIRMHKAHSSQLPLYGAPVGHNRDAFMVPFFPRHRHSEYFVDSRSLGYDYDDFHYGGMKRRDPDTYIGDKDEGDVYLLILAIAAPVLLFILFVGYILFSKLSPGGINAYKGLMVPTSLENGYKEKLQLLDDVMTDSDE